MSKRTLVILLVVLALVIALAGVGIAKHEAKAPLTGTIDRTYSKGQCQAGTKCWDCRQAVDLDRVTINVDTTADANGKAIDAVHFGPGCTGRIGFLDIQTQSADSIKISTNPGGCSNIDLCAHDLVIDGGSVYSSGTLPTGAHRDGLQALGGLRITFYRMKVWCQCNNALWYLTWNKANLKPGDTPPTDVVCVDCEFHTNPAALHGVTISHSVRSGFRNSLICPGSSKNLQFLVDANAQQPVDVNNTKPFPAGSDQECR